jgi:hypothetical protein
MISVGLGGQSSAGSREVITPVLLPEPRREFSHARRRMYGDALEHIDQIRVRIDAMQSARNDQTLNDADVSCAEFSPTK